MDIKDIPPMMMSDDAFMELAVAEAYQGMLNKHGGPFGAVIVHKETNEVLAYGHNTVLKDNDPTAHGEMNAIRNACKELGSIDLSQYKIYTTGYPCPMCMNAIKWANMDEVYYGMTSEQIEEIGFRDKKLYDGEFKITMIQCGQQSCCKMKDAYEDMPHDLY